MSKRNRIKANRIKIAAVVPVTSVVKNPFTGRDVGIQIVDHQKLFLAAETGRVDEVRELLAQGPRFNEKAFLTSLAQGTNVNTDNDKASQVLMTGLLQTQVLGDALLLAVKNEHIAVVSLLLRRNDPINIEDSVAYALQNDLHEILEIFMQLRFDDFVNEMHERNVREFPEFHKALSGNTEKVEKSIFTGKPTPFNVQDNKDGSVNIYLTGGNRPQREVDTGASKMQQATERGENLIRQGVEQKRKRNFTEAEKLYHEAIDLAPNYVKNYSALGKLYYLMNDRTKSLLYYTVAAHLDVSLGAARALDDEHEKSRSWHLAGFPAELLAQFRSLHPHADLLLVDDNTPRHLGHSLVDLQDGEALSPELAASATAYRQNIGGGFYAQIDLDLEQTFYRPAGVSYLVDNIQWSKVGKLPPEQVLAFYSDENTGRLTSQAAEAELTFAMAVLRRDVGIVFPSTNQPCADLLRDLLALQERVTLQPVLEKSAQTASRILSGSFYASMGSALLDALGKSATVQPLMMRRWRDTIGSTQTPFADAWFDLDSHAKMQNQPRPMLSAVMATLRSQELRYLRNNVIHEYFSWRTDAEGTYLRLTEKDGVTFWREISSETCEAFHIVLGSCALVTDRLMRQYKP